MFHNIGGKCKSLARVLCWLGIILSVIVGLLYIGNDSALFGIGYMLGGALVSWLSSLGLYAIGEAAENSAIAARNTEEIKKMLLKNAAAAQPAPSSAAQPTAPRQAQPQPPQEAPARPEFKPVPEEERQESCRAIPLPDGQEQCAQCGTLQRSGRVVCWHCGAKFIRED